MTRVPSSEHRRRLEDDGGFTFSEKSQSFAEDGVFSSVYGHEKVVPGGATDTDIDTYRAENKNALLQDQQFLGGWRSQAREGGGTADYLDVSKRFVGVEEAKEFGRRNAQDAVFDLGTFTEHPVDYGEYPADAPGKQVYNRVGRKSVDVHHQARAAQAAGDEGRMRALADEIGRLEYNRTVLKELVTPPVRRSRGG